MKASEAVPGSWYTIKGHDSRCLCLPSPIDSHPANRFLMRSIAYPSQLTIEVLKTSELIELPECDSWEWQPDVVTIPEAGYGWRLLGKDEMVEEGDECRGYISDSEWKEARNRGLQSTICNYRRRIDVGDGYRLVGLDEDKLATDDVNCAKNYTPEIYANGDYNTGWIKNGKDVPFNMIWDGLIYRRKLEPPKPTYRPFRDAAEFTPYRGWWATTKNGMIFRVNEYDDISVNGWSWHHALNNWKFNDGSPFGVEVK